MHLKFLTLLLTLTSASLLYAGPRQVITEKQLLQLARQKNPSTMAILASQAAASAENYSLESRFDPKLNAQYDYASSNEDAIIQFLPVFHPQRTFQVGVEQKFALGMKARLGVFGQQISTADGFINNATQLGTQLGLEIDIWKNFLGNLDRADLRSKRLQSKIAELQADTDKSSFLLDIRKLYWVLVSNEISLNLSQELVKTARKQLKVSLQRAKEGAADKSDVARNRALVQSRESAVLSFTYLREVYSAQLKALLPELKGKELVIDATPARLAEREAKICIAQIRRQSSVNQKHSHYPTIIELLKERKANELRVANATDSMEVKLTGQYQASGVDSSTSEAFDRFSDQFKNGYQVGININIPLGSDLSKARASRVAVVENQFGSQIRKLDLQLASEHDKVRRSLIHLDKALAAQEGIVKDLNISLKQTQKKYRQARVSLNTLILEQDNAFNASLQQIDTKRQIIHLLLDYFKVFNRFPCNSNTMPGGQS